MITSTRKNIMGTVSVTAQFAGMRKPQEFIVYPLKDAAPMITIQSDTRIGHIHLESGTVTLSRPKPNGAYFIHLNGAQIAGRLSGEDLLMLKAAIMGTASDKVGINGIVYCDNSAALDVFAQVQE